MSVGKKYVTKDDLEAFARKLIRKIVGSTIGLSGSGAAGGGGVSSFLDLNDVPGDYTDDGLKVVRVNAAEDALEFFDIELNDLHDVDLESGNAPSDGDCLTYDGVLGRWVAAPCGGGGSGAISICDLLDVDCGSPYIPEDGDVLVYDAASGDWRPSPAFSDILSAVHSFRVQGRYYGGVNGAPSLSTGVYGADYLRAVPFVVSRTTSFDRIGLGVTAGGGVTRYMRLGIYANKAGNYAYPGALVLDSGQITVSANAYYEVNIDQALSPGLYYLAFLNSYQFTIRIFTAVYGALPVGGAPDGATNYETYFTVSRAYAALPDPYPNGAAISSVANPPHIVLRVK